MRLIDADAFEVFTYTYRNNDFDDGVQYVLEAIDNAPTIEPKKGKWIDNSPVTCKCDQCGYVIRDWFVNQFGFCPNCGADMRGEDK